MGAIKWMRTYLAMLAAPLEVGDVWLGHLAWIAVRLAIVVTIYLGVMAAFGVVYSPWAIVALPAGVLTGMAFAAPIGAWSATLDKDAPFSTLYRFVIIPLFLFSGIFFPISQLPRSSSAWPTSRRCSTAWRCAGTSRSGRSVGGPGARGLSRGLGRAGTPSAGARSPSGWWCDGEHDLDRSSTAAPARRHAHHAAGLLGGRHAARVLERNILVYRRSWIFLVSGFFEPLFYLLSIGIGLTHLVGPIPVDGKLVPYTAFVAPGLLASSAMNGAMIDSTFQVFFKLKIAKTYDAMLATPLGVGDVAMGELSWWCCGARSTRGPSWASWRSWATWSRRGPCCAGRPPSSRLALASAGMAGTTYMRTWQDFDMVSLAFIPLFLFSATFYPLTVYPGWLQAVVRCTPLYQGVVLSGPPIWASSTGSCWGTSPRGPMAVGEMVVDRRRMGRLLLR